MFIELQEKDTEELQLINIKHIVSIEPITHYLQKIHFNNDDQTTYLVKYKDLKEKLQKLTEPTFFIHAPGESPFDAKAAQNKELVAECAIMVDTLTTMYPGALGDSYTYEHLVNLGHRLNGNEVPLKEEPLKEEPPEPIMAKFDCHHCGVYGVNVPLYEWEDLNIEHEDCPEKPDENPDEKPE